MDLNDPRVPCTVIYRASLDGFEIRRAGSGEMSGDVRVLIITRDDVLKRHCNGLRITPELFEAMRKVLAVIDARQMRGEDMDLSINSTSYGSMFPFNLDRPQEESECCAVELAQTTKEAAARAAALEKEFNEKKKRQCRHWTILFSTMWLVAGLIGLFAWTGLGWKGSVCIFVVVGSIQNLISNIWHDGVYLGVNLEHWCLYGASLVLGPTFIAQYVGVSHIGVGFGVLILAIGIMHAIWKVLLPWGRRKRKIDR